MQYVASQTNSVQTIFYNNVAKEAANAGAAMAYNCLQQAGNVDTPAWEGRTLRPHLACDGQTTVSSNQLVSGTSSSMVRSTFEVLSPTKSGANPDITSSGAKITAIGRVSFYYAGSSTPTRTFEQRTIINIPLNLAASNIPIAQGRAVTQISSGQHFSCSVANQELWCWGSNTLGQMGLTECLTPILGWKCITGAISADNKTSPVRVNTKHIANKRVDSVSAGSIGACAVAEGRGQCWGSNSYGQVGTGDTSLLELFNTLNPFAGLTDVFYFGFDDLAAGPRYAPSNIAGALNGANVTKISYGWSAGSFPDRVAVCGLANGKVYCWGNNNYAQLGQPKYSGTIAGIGISCNDWWTEKDWIGLNSKYLCAGLLTTPPTTFLTSQPGKAPVPVYGFANRDNREQTSVALFAGKRALDVSTGMAGTCAIATGGKVYCWGDFAASIGGDTITNGLTQQAANTQKTDMTGSALSGKRANSVAAGSATGCAVAEGNGYCWGRLRGDGGQNTANSNRPKLVDLGGALVNTVAARDETNGPMCMLGSGNIYCWGLNQPGTTTPIVVGDSSPSAIPGLPSGKITDIGTGAGSDASSGLGFFLTPGAQCVTINSTVYCKGFNTVGQLGRGFTSSSSTLLPWARTTNEIGLTAGEAATAVSAGANHTCAIINSQPFCWGANGSGQLGQGNYVQQPRPTSVIGLTTNYTSKISAGSTHTCSVTDNRAYCWGANGSRQLGDGTMTTSNLPVAATGLTGLAVTDISAGTNHTCAIASGDAWCWGSNSNGQLGQGNTTTYTSPVKVTTNLAGKLVTSITAGNNFTCAVADGEPYCWGIRSNGRIGNGGSTSGNTTTPTLVSGMTGATTNIEAGDSSVCAVEGGVTKCWGAGADNRLGVGSGGTSDRTTPMIVRRANTTDETNNTTSISVGSNHSCGMIAGYLKCWGSQTSGKVGNGTSSSSSSITASVTEANGASLLGEQNKPLSVSAGTDHTCAIANGKIFCWGSNTQGQLGTGVAGGSQTTPVVTTNYSRNTTEVAWGDTVFY